MDRIDAMRLFVRVVERRGFARAAQDFALPRSSVTNAVKGLERHLGRSLLHRTTRRVSPTVEGEDYYRRCLSILAEIDDAEAAFADVKPKGLVRVDIHGVLAGRFLLPGLPAFLAEYPDVRLHIGEGDRLVDLVREGVDCVVRVGELSGGSLVGRRIGRLHEGTFAAPTYLERHGVPETIDDLAQGHAMIGFVSSATGRLIPFECCVEDERREVALPANITVTGAATLVGLAKLGFGLVQVPRYRLADDLAAGKLVEVLANCPPSPSPVHVLYPESRSLSPRVRVFVDWLVTEVGGRLKTDPANRAAE